MALYPSLSCWIRHSRTHFQASSWASPEPSLARALAAHLQTLATHSFSETPANLPVLLSRLQQGDPQSLLAPVDFPASLRARMNPRSPQVWETWATEADSAELCRCQPVVIDLDFPRLSSPVGPDSYCPSTDADFCNSRTSAAELVAYCYNFETHCACYLLQNYCALEYWNVCRHYLVLLKLHNTDTWREWSVSKLSKRQMKMSVRETTVLFIVIVVSFFAEKTLQLNERVVLWSNCFIKTLILTLLRKA